MWVVDLGTCAIHMDHKPHHFQPPSPPKREPSSSDQQHDSTDQQASDVASATDERTKKRTRRVVDSSTTCAPEQLHCRYANKKCLKHARLNVQVVLCPQWGNLMNVLSHCTCLNPRAVKRTGGLHTFCANRNQRRLDMRKRMARHALREQTEGGQTPSTPNATTPRQQGIMKPEDIEVVPSPMGQFDERFEPLHTPTPLQEEDISTLVTLFLPPVNDIGFHFGNPTPTTPHDWPSDADKHHRHLHREACGFEHHYDVQYRQRNSKNEIA
ncbi:hypothetical protein P3T76_003937 [Phytophthora citrophthora]|uniref:Uncharacterized protein n=1 Tax=Phytophthora citrophthora TaxID=4793 RepID=A0AAD9GT15_9STRA|nr:hypothetical protein P3T76_003937 [Phytophthora citrophthora]